MSVQKQLLQFDGAIDEVGRNDVGENFVRLTHKEASLVITGISDNQAKRLAASLFSEIELQLSTVE